MRVDGLEDVGSEVSCWDVGMPVDGCDVGLSVDGLEVVGLDVGNRIHLKVRPLNAE